jgi:cytochrome c-type protein NapC
MPSILPFATTGMCRNPPSRIAREHGRASGIKDVIGEMRGAISTEEAFKKERLRMAQLVWAEYKADNSRHCRSCHQITPDVVAKQKDFVKPMHEQVLDGRATCIDCHKGVAHAAPSE